MKTRICLTLMIILIAINAIYIYHILCPEKKDYELVMVDYSQDGRYRAEIKEGEKIYIMMGENLTYYIYQIYDVLSEEIVCEVKFLRNESVMEKDHICLNWQEEYVEMGLWESKGKKTSVRLYYEDVEHIGEM